jgi:hypothetical protein
MAWVWETSPSEGTALLVELALADYADDAGACWPAMGSIAKKARSTERYAREVIRRMAADGRLDIEEQRGRNHTNRYRFLGVKTGTPVPNFSGADDEKTGTVKQENRNSETPKTGTVRRKTGTVKQENRNPSSADPSGIVKEPSLDPSRNRQSGRTRKKPLHELTDEEFFELRAYLPNYRPQWTVEKCEGVLEHFRDHHASLGNLFADWKAALRKWARNEDVFNASKGGKGGSNGRNGRSNGHLNGNASDDAYLVSLSR